MSKKVEAGDNWIEEFTKEENVRFRAAFDLFDEVGNGTIERNELKSVLAMFNIKPTEKELNLMMSDIDKDNDGRINYAEFVSLMKNQSTERDIELEISEAFDLFDQDKNGAISVSELVTVMTSLGELISHDEAMDMIREAKCGETGEVTKEEFRKLILKTQGKNNK